MKISLLFYTFGMILLMVIGWSLIKPVDDSEVQTIYQESTKILYLISSLLSFITGGVFDLIYIKSSK